jgi:thioredoxin reductase (NADPH)
VVIGGGDAAFDYSLNLMSRDAKVIIVSRSNPVCLSLLRGRADEGGVEVLVGMEADDIKGSTGKVTVHCTGKAGEREIEADYILLACGREPNSEIIDVSLQVQISKHEDIPRTNILGLFMAGDVVRGKHRQAAISVGDGVHAGMMADEYLKSVEAKR